MSGKNIWRNENNLKCILHYILPIVVKFMVEYYNMYISYLDT